MCEKIILIGNGSSALIGKYGKEIDEFSLVCRFNTYKIKGFEENVGTKTDIWVACDVFPAWHKDYQRVICCSFHRTQDNGVLLKLRKRYPDCDHFPEWAWKETMKNIGYSAPSSGAVAATYFSKDYEVYIYGYDFFAGPKHHYGNNSNACHHQAKLEMEYFRKLIADKRIVPFHNYISKMNYNILHNIYPEYGAGGAWYGDIITKIAKENDVETILDYGCGKGSLVRLLSKSFKTYGYDSYVKEYSNVPDIKMDMVVSTDFLEHVEEEDLDEIFKSIKSYEPRVQFHAISNRKATQILPDGRNAHLTIKPSEWWEKKLSKLGAVECVGHNDTQDFTIYKIF